MARRAEYYRLRNARGRSVIEQALTTGCVDCGTKDLRVLEFDHVRGKKRRQISGMVRASRENLLAEIAKCDVRCANCHRIVTGIRAGWWAAA